MTMGMIKTLGVKSFKWKVGQPGMSVKLFLLRE